MQHTSKESESSPPSFNAGNLATLELTDHLRQLDPDFKIGEQDTLNGTCVRSVYFMGQWWRIGTQCDDADNWHRLAMTIAARAVVVKP